MDVSNLKVKLEEIAAENHYEGKTIEIKPKPSAGSNFTTQLYTATISAPNKTDLKLFAKVGFSNEDTRKLINAPVLYNTERYAYTELIPEYKKIQDKYNIPEEERVMFPKCYGVVVEKLHETVVLGDLTAEGFESFDRLSTIDLDYAKEGIRQLAKMHAMSFTMRRDNPEKFKDLMARFEFDPTTSLETHNRWTGLVEAVTRSIKEDYKPKLADFLKVHGDASKFEHYYKPLSVPTLNHGDYRHSNMMHKKLSDGKPKIIPVDYQTVQTGCPANDFIYFMFTGTDRQFRKKHLDSLRDYYHSQLGTELARFSIEVNDVYPRDTFEQEYKTRLPYALLVGIFVLPIITLHITEDFPKVDNILNQKELCGALFVSRFTDIMDDFIEYGLIS